MSENLQEHNINVTKTARYYTLGDISNTEEVWVVCHGQGQLASYFIKSFQNIVKEKRLIVAPEGLSRFYLDNMGGRVGACWMTREDRLNEIDNYVNYLDLIYEQIIASVNNPNIKLQVLGFSQGVATVCRWVGLGKPKPIDKLILWGGITPPDLDLVAANSIFSHLKLFLVVGNQDQFADASVVAHEEERLKNDNLSYKLITYEGGHQLNIEVIKDLAEC
ncbi:MAG: phospholipase/carboxylesterase [bacterium]|nr:MAG: phospholipase/carboxylesterase [bacterium]